MNQEYRDAGIVVNLDREVPVDESGGAYKSSKSVIAAITRAGLAEVEHRLWPLASLKGHDRQRSFVSVPSALRWIASVKAPGFTIRRPECRMERHVPNRIGAVFLRVLREQSSLRTLECDHPLIDVGSRLSRGAVTNAFSAQEGFELCERAIDATYDRHTHPWVTHREVVDWLMQDPAARGDIDRWTAHKGGGMTPFRMVAAAHGLFCKSWSVPATSDPPSRYEARADGETYRPRRR